MNHKLADYFERCGVQQDEKADFILASVGIDRQGTFIKVHKPDLYLCMKHIPTGIEFEINSIDEYNEMIESIEATEENDPVTEAIYYDIMSSQRQFAETRFVLFFQVADEILKNQEQVLFLLLFTQHPEYISKFITWKFETSNIQFQSEFEFGRFFKIHRDILDWDWNSGHVGYSSFDDRRNITLAIKPRNSNIILELDFLEVLHLEHAISEKYFRAIGVKLAETIIAIDQHFIDNPRKIDTERPKESYGQSNLKNIDQPEDDLPF